jgi:hypothetical protein
MSFWNSITFSEFRRLRVCRMLAPMSVLLSDSSAPGFRRLYIRFHESWACRCWSFPSWRCKCVRVGLWQWNSWLSRWPCWLFICRIHVQAPRFPERLFEDLSVGGYERTSRGSLTAECRMIAPKKSPGRCGLGLFGVPLAVDNPVSPTLGIKGLQTVASARLLEEWSNCPKIDVFLGSSNHPQTKLTAMSWFG